jgi:hypothetical protein
VSRPSDADFHRDCHLGRHAYVCSGMTVGIALTPTRTRLSGAVTFFMKQGLFHEALPFP